MQFITHDLLIYVLFFFLKIPIFHDIWLFLSAISLKWLEIWLQKSVKYITESEIYETSSFITVGHNLISFFAKTWIIFHLYVCIYGIFCEAFSIFIPTGILVNENNSFPHISNGVGVY